MLELLDIAVLPGGFPGLFGEFRAEAGMLVGRLFLLNLLFRE